MAMVFEGTPQQYSLDGYLKSNLDAAKNVIKEDWDMVFCVDGTEGGGKSVLAMQCAFYCDPTLSFDRYAFTPIQFKNAINKAEKYQAVVYDEAHSGLNSRAAMSQINRALVSMLTQIRQKNLFVFILLPTFFDLDKYVALWRSRALIHVYTAEKFKRGYFSFYNANSKKMLYLKGHKLYQYGAAKPNFIGRFTNHYPLDEKEYRKKKLDALHGKENLQDEQVIADKAKQLMWERLMEIGDELTHAKKMLIMEMPETTYYWNYKKWQQKHDIGV